MGEPTLDSCICKGSRHENPEKFRFQETLPLRRTRAKRRRGQKICYRENTGHLYKYCQNCGARFYPSMYHVRDQIYCKDAKCWKERGGEQMAKEMLPENNVRQGTRQEVSCAQDARAGSEEEAEGNFSGYCPESLISAVKYLSASLFTRAS